MFGHTDLIGKNMQRRFEREDDELFPLIAQKEAVLKEIEELDFGVALYFYGIPCH